jgi:hypothetical protein
MTPPLIQTDDGYEFHEDLVKELREWALDSYFTLCAIKRETSGEESKGKETKGRIYLACTMNPKYKKTHSKNGRKRIKNSIVVYKLIFLGYNTT